MAQRGLSRTPRPRRAPAAPLGVQQNAYYAKQRESYFIDYVRHQLIKQYGAARVRQGGLRSTRRST